VYAAEPRTALALVAQRGIVDRVPNAKPKKLQNHQTELKVIICDCHMKKNQRFLTQKCVNKAFFVAKIGKYGIFVAQICKYGIFCREIL